MGNRRVFSIHRAGQSQLQSAEWKQAIDLSLRV